MKRIGEHLELVNNDVGSANFNLYMLQEIGDYLYIYNRYMYTSPFSFNATSLRRVGTNTNVHFNYYMSWAGLPSLEQVCSQPKVKI